MGVVIELRSREISAGYPGGDFSTRVVDEIGTASATLAHRCWAWESLPLPVGRELLAAVIAATGAVAPRWVAVECERKHVAWGSPVAGEEWWNGPLSAIRAARRLQATLIGVEREAHARARASVTVIHGNDSVSSMPFIETIETLYSDGQLVLLQLTPGTSNIARVLDAALHPLIDDGYVRIVTGEPVTESGSVTPVIVAPGEWSKADFRRQARMIATMLTHGGSYEPGAARMLITHRGWSGRQQLLLELRAILRGVSNRFAFHPGAQGRFARFMQAHPEMELLGAGHIGSLPWGLITDVNPHREDLVFTSDPFAPLLSETSLRSSSVAGFIDEAVALCNERVSGSLVATLIADQSWSRDPVKAAALERGLQQLGYHAVTINAPAFVALAGRSTRVAGQEGKSVLRGHFRSVTQPPWLVTHSHSREVFRKLTRYEAAPSSAQLPAIIWRSIRA